MRVENKMFYFDVGQNRRGVFMRISEVSSHEACRNLYTTQEINDKLSVRSMFYKNVGSYPK